MVVVKVMAHVVEEEAVARVVGAKVRVAEATVEVAMAMVAAAKEKAAEGMAKAAAGSVVAAELKAEEVVTAAGLAEAPMAEGLPEPPWTGQPARECQPLSCSAQMRSSPPAWHSGYLLPRLPVLRRLGRCIWSQWRPQCCQQMQSRKPALLRHPACWQPTFGRKGCRNWRRQLQR